MARRKGRISTGDNGLSIVDIYPSGAVLAFAGTSVPTGWLLCDGSAVSRTTYSNLYRAIGVAHGYGDNSTTFNIPDYRGRFLRGVASSQTTDPDRASRTAMATGGNTGDNVGSIQGHAFETHTHTGSTGTESATHTHSMTGRRQSSPVANSGYNFDAVNGSSATGGAVTPDTGNQSANHTHTIPISDRAASGTHSQASTNETRPVNAGVHYIIKV